MKSFIGKMPLVPPKKINKIRSPPPKKMKDDPIPWAPQED